MSDEADAQRWLDGMPTFFQDIVQRTNRVTNRDVHVHYRTHRSTLHLMFTSVPPELRPAAALVSALGVALVCFVDYWADTVPRLDLVEEAAAHVLSGASPRSEGLAMLPEIWGEYLRAVSEGPAFAGVQELLMKEWGALFESMRYAILVNTDNAQPHTYRTAMAKLAANMLGVHKHVVDISFSPGWEACWTAPALELASKMERVVRIGNCLKSWRQELSLQRDISSTVCAAALQYHVVDRESLKRGDTQHLIMRIESTPIPALEGLTVLEFLQKEMARFLLDIERMEQLQFVDVPSYLKALRRVVADQMRGSYEKR